MKKYLALIGFTRVKGRSVRITVAKKDRKDDKCDICWNKFDHKTIQI